MQNHEYPGNQPDAAPAPHAGMQAPSPASDMPPNNMKQKDGVSMPQNFLSLTGGCVLYCLSALSIVYGLVRVINPILLSTEDTWTRLLCIGALNGYEAAVLGVLLLIVLWRNVLDDAISLVIIISVLLPVIAIAANMIVLDNRSAGFPVGLAGLALAGANVFAFRKYLLMRMDSLFLAGIGFMLAWGMLMPSVLALMVQKGLVHGNALWNALLAGWTIALAGGAIWWLQAVRTPAGRSLEDHVNAPFLRTPGMAWIFGAIVFAGMGVQQYALTYVFELRFCAAFVLPVIAIACLTGMELLYAYKVCLGHKYYIVALAPLFACLFAHVKGPYVGGPGTWLPLFWHPPALIALTGAGVAIAAYLRRHKEMWFVVGIYALALVLTWGTAGGGGLEALKWMRALILLEVAMVALSIRLRNPYLALMAWIGAGLACGLSDAGEAVAYKLGLKDSGALGIMLAMAGAVATEAIFKRRLHILISLVAACWLVMQAVAAFGLCNSPVPCPWTSALILVALGGLVAWRAKNYIVCAVLCYPFLRVLYYVFRSRTGWEFVILSFPLLAAGAYLSLRKGRLKGNSGNKPVGKSQ